jgi:hypothetical protein
MASSPTESNSNYQLDFGALPIGEEFKLSEDTSGGTVVTLAAAP